MTAGAFPRRIAGTIRHWPVTSLAIALTFAPLPVLMGMASGALSPEIGTWLMLGGPAVGLAALVVYRYRFGKGWKRHAGSSFEIAGRTRRYPTLETTVDGRSVTAAVESSWSYPKRRTVVEVPTSDDAADGFEARLSAGSLYPDRPPADPDVLADAEAAVDPVDLSGTVEADTRVGVVRFRTPGVVLETDRLQAQAEAVAGVADAVEAASGTSRE